MSRQGVNKPGPSWEELQLKYEIINHRTRGSQQEGHWLSKEEIEEMRQRDEETTWRGKQMDQTLLFITVAGTMCKLGIHAWYSWCVAIPVMLATGVQAQDASML